MSLLSCFSNSLSGLPSEAGAVTLAAFNAADTLTSVPPFSAGPGSRSNLTVIPEHPSGDETLLNRSRLKARSDLLGGAEPYAQGPRKARDGNQCKRGNNYPTKAEYHPWLVGRSRYAHPIKYINAVSPPTATRRESSLRVPQAVPYSVVRNQARTHADTLRSSCTSSRKSSARVRYS